MSISNSMSRSYGFVFEQMGMHEYAKRPWMAGPYEGATVLPTVPCYVHKKYEPSSDAVQNKRVETDETDETDEGTNTNRYDICVV